MSFKLRHKPYVPEPYRDFLFMRQVVYDHLFPSPTDDTELLHLCDAVIIEAERRRQDIKYEKRSLGERPRAAPPTIHGHYDTPSPNEMKRSIQHNRLDRENQSLFEAIGWGNNILESIRQDTYNPVLSLLNSESHQFWGDGKQWNLFQPIPRGMMGFAYARQQGFFEIVSGALYSGVLKAYNATSNYGIIGFPNRNIWLDSEIAIPALKTGRAAPLVERPDYVVDMLFDGDELASLFPLLETAREVLGTPKSRGRPPQHLEIEAALRQIFPGTIPDALSIKAARTTISKHLQKTVADGVFRKARKAVYGNTMR